MRLIYIIFALIYLVSCQQQTRNCNDYRTGLFKVAKVDSLISETLIECTENYQIETFEQYYKRDFNGNLVKTLEKHQDTFSINWVNNCEFVLKKKHPINKFERKAFFVKILTTTDESYYFQGRFEDNKGLTYQTAYA